MALSEKESVSFLMIITSALMSVAALILDAEAFIRGFLPTAEELALLTGWVVDVVNLATSSPKSIFISVLLIIIIMLAVVSPILDNRTETTEIRGRGREQ